MKTDDSARNFGVPNFWTSPNLVKRNQAQLGICIEKTLYKYIYIYTYNHVYIYFYIHVYVCIYAVSINLMYVIYVHSLNYSSLAPY